MQQNIEKTREIGKVMFSVFYMKISKTNFDYSTTFKSSSWEFSFYLLHQKLVHYANCAFQDNTTTYRLLIIVIYFMNNYWKEIPKSQLHWHQGGGAFEKKNHMCWKKTTYFLVMRVKSRDGVMNVKKAYIKADRTQNYAALSYEIPEFCPCDEIYSGVTSLVFGQGD